MVGSRSRHRRSGLSVAQAIQAFQATTAAQPVTPAQQQTLFSPPLAMQKSVWDSIVNGNFIDAKIFAFSRRSNNPGRVTAPKALFINTHVLAAACSYFRSTFDLSDGIATSLTGGFPPDEESSFDMKEQDLDIDYDDPVEDSVEEDLDIVDVDILPERAVKAYVVKYTAYRTLHAIIWYIYSGEINFSPNDSQESPSASAKSIYLFADEHSMDDLKKLAFGEIAASIDRLGASQLVEEAFSVFTSRYPELQDLYAKRLRSVLSSYTLGAEDSFRGQLFRYFSGELPHGRDILTSLLHTLVDVTAVSNPLGELSGGCNIIPRVSHPWPARTGKALRLSLDKGVFEDFHFRVPPGPAPTKHLMHFAGAVDEAVALSISLFCHAQYSDRNDAGTALSSWQAIAYYVYTDFINTEPLASGSPEIGPACGPSDANFRGYPCSLREVLYLARRINLHASPGAPSGATACSALIDRLNAEMVSSLTPENVVEEMFCGLPPSSRVVDRGVEIIRLNRSNGHIRSQLQKVLDEAASGKRPGDFATFFSCFSGLYA